ncbi:hypothetical protein [Streptacidiphilus cavernicola]|uniref:DUF2029 domain-containing protein n=1 Tax=Streptacidiphilus cavernicola TaxID=3342716 RepID=A0ABV6VTE9_9ACTN
MDLHRAAAGIHTAAGAHTHNAAAGTRAAAGRRFPARAEVLAGLGAAALTAALAGTVTSGATLGGVTPLRGWYLADALLFALAITLLRRVRDPRRTAALVLVGSVALALTGLLAPPRTSDDAYRYLWDGHVQAAGVSPYTYTPTDPALAGLRAADPALFPVGGSCVGWDLHRSGAICTHINRPTVHTIYPPVAEAWFLGLYQAGRITGGHGVRTAQAGGALLAVLSTGALLLILRRRRVPPHRAALWGWFPGVALWAVNDAHVDTLGVLLMTCGLATTAYAATHATVRPSVQPGASALPGPSAQPGASAARGASLGAVLLGAATATKLIPVLALPGAMAGVLRRGHRPGPRDLLVPAVALLTFLLCYLPYVLASGLGVIGYLPGYLQEEGYDQGTRFGLLTLLGLPLRLLPALVAVILVATVLLVLRLGDPERPWRGALLVTGTALFLAAPGYPWYSLLVVALVALDGRWEWLGLPAAAAAVVVFGGNAQQPAYAAALCLLLAVTAVRTLLATATAIAAVTAASAVTAPVAQQPPPRPDPAAPAGPAAPVAPTPIRTASSR